MTKKKWKNHSGELLDTKDGYDVINCRRCGYTHIIPVPNEKELDRYYTKQFYTEDKPVYFKRQKSELDWWNMVYEERLLRFEKRLPKKRRRILDIGSGPGFFLKLGKERGWETLGIEPSSRAAEYAQAMELDIINGFLTPSLAKKIGKFDVVHMQYVMEHMQDPKAVIKLCHSILKPGGLFCTVVANDYNPLQKILKEKCGYKPWWVVPPEHINYFDIKSLRQLVNSCGFKVIDTMTAFPMEMFLLMGDNYIGRDRMGKNCHKKRRSFEFALRQSPFSSLKSKLYKDFAKHGIGREIDLTASKPK